MKNQLTPFLIMLFVMYSGYGQTHKSSSKNSFFITPEIVVGKTQEANTDFPERTLNKGFYLSFGKKSNVNKKAWAAQLHYPKTGFTIGIDDFGNTEKIGKAYTIMPFLEFGLLKKKTQPLHLQMGFGASYLDTKYHAISNPLNKAITTDFNWSFRSFFYYDFLKKARMNWRLGLGYLHHSNGHTRLPNQGLNSFVLSFSSSIKTSNSTIEVNGIEEEPQRTKTSQSYFSVRTGIGQNVLSEVVNTKKEVYSVAFSLGKIYNKTFKFGGGFYYRFYEHYYDYIKNDGFLIEEQVSFFKDAPFRYASNYGLFFNTELLLSHIGIGFDIGMNISKPFYKIDWQISQGKTFNDVYFPAELDWYYEIKRTVSSRLGLTYYLINTLKSPKNNLFVAAHINANLGQADFSELSLGYVHRFDLKKKVPF